MCTTSRSHRARSSNCSQPKSCIFCGKLPPNYELLYELVQGSDSKNDFLPSTLDERVVSPRRPDVLIAQFRVQDESISAELPRIRQLDAIKNTIYHFHWWASCAKVCKRNPDSPIQVPRLGFFNYRSGSSVIAGLKTHKRTRTSENRSKETNIEQKYSGRLWSESGIPFANFYHKKKKKTVQNTCCSNSIVNRRRH